MRRLSQYALLVAVISLLTSSLFAATLPARSPDADVPQSSGKQFAAPEPSPLGRMTVGEFLSLTPAQYRALTGEKLTLIQRLSLKISQHRVRRLLKKHQLTEQAMLIAPVSGGSSDFNIVGFVLGMIIGPIGVLIAYITKDRTMIKWAWVGFAVFAAILLLTLIV